MPAQTPAAPTHLSGVSASDSDENSAYSAASADLRLNSIAHSLRQLDAHPTCTLQTYAGPMSAKSPSKLEVVGCFALDAAVVILFVAVGRSTRGEGPWGILVTAWPFLVGLVGGWLIARAWRQPRIIQYTSIIVWLSTVGIGMVLRALLGQDVESRFVFISIVALGAFMLGWRAIAWILTVLFGKNVPEPNVEPATGRTTTPKNRPGGRADVS